MTNEEAIKVLSDPTFMWYLWRVEQEEAIELAIKALEQQRTGMWYIRPNGAMDKCYCSICEHGFDLDKIKMMWEHYELPPHCPACGSRMGGDE